MIGAAAAWHRPLRVTALPSRRVALVQVLSLQSRIMRNLFSDLQSGGGDGGSVRCKRKLEDQVSEGRRRSYAAYVQAF